MAVHTHQEVADYIVGPDGRKLTLADLPPADTTRWVVRRKAEVIAAIKGGLLSQEQAIDYYNLTLEEFNSWIEKIDEYGIAGLRTTRILHYRRRQKSA